jgi:hypothetical protein
VGALERDLQPTGVASIASCPGRILILWWLSVAWWLTSLAMVLQLRGIGGAQAQLRGLKYRRGLFF